MLLGQCCRCGPQSSVSESAGTPTDSSSSSSSGFSGSTLSVSGSDGQPHECYCDAIPQFLEFTIEGLRPNTFGETCCRDLEGDFRARYVGRFANVNNCVCTAIYETDARAQCGNPFPLEDYPAYHLVLVFGDCKLTENSACGSNLILLSGNKKTYQGRASNNEPVYTLGGVPGAYFGGWSTNFEVGGPGAPECVSGKDYGDPVQVQCLSVNKVYWRGSDQGRDTCFYVQGGLGTPDTIYVPEVVVSPG
jgi:hypothetical protein